MAVDIDLFIEVYEEGAWHFDGELIPNPELEVSSEPELVLAMVPAPVYRSNSKGLATILTGNGRISSAEREVLLIVPAPKLPEDLSTTLQNYFNWMHDYLGVDFSKRNPCIHYSAITASQFFAFDLDSRLLSNDQKVTERIEPYKASIHEFTNVI